MNISKGSLENKLKYLSVFDKNSNSISVIYLVKAGSRSEDEKSSGLAHFIEHNFFKGTKTYPTSKSLGMAIENMGGSSNAFTSYEYTGYYIKAPKEKFDETIALIADIIKNPLFPSAELEREKGVIIEEIKMYQDIPMSKVNDVFMEQLFGDHPLGRDIAGSVETVSSFERENVINFIEKNYNSENVLISVAGGIENEKAIQKIEEYFSDINNTGNLEFERFEKDTHIYKKSKSIAKEIEQTHIILGGYGYDRNFEDRVLLDIGFAILGSGFGSILFQVIREELGLAYYINARHSEFQEVGFWKVRMGVDNNRFEEAVERLIKELNKFKSGDFSNSDLERAKNYYIGNLVTEIETSEEIAMWYGMQELLQKEVKMIEDIKKEVRAITKEQVLELIRTIITKENILITSLGPKKLDHAGILSNVV